MGTLTIPEHATRFTGAAGTAATWAEHEDVRGWGMFRVVFSDGATETRYYSWRNAEDLAARLAEHGPRWVMFGGHLPEFDDDEDRGE